MKFSKLYYVYSLLNEKGKTKTVRRKQTLMCSRKLKVFKLMN